MEKLNKIKIGGVSYSIKCDNLVLEKIQEEYGSVSAFEMELAGLKKAYEADGTIKRDEKGVAVLEIMEPSIKAINFALPLMINEGMEIEAELKGTAFEPVDEKKLIRSVDIPFKKLAETLHEEFKRCFVSKK